MSTQFIIEPDGIVEPAKKLSVIGKYDVLVAGGGPAGFGAAVAAARKGCKTLLIERESSLGGLATVGLVPIPLDQQTGISKEMIANLEAVDAHWHRNSDPEKHKLILDRMLKASGADLLLATHIVEAITQPSQKILINPLTSVFVDSRTSAIRLTVGSLR